ncbi:probable basic-leucine zipper transcription factor F isoform X1 [Cotesia glomerata]|uniref:OTU domain-containing protein n=1 Tax=Cotesia glomerata TaxID=32391 RepID=A0AAV7IJ01_COTGL|nr:probable basic-leucine zipper transcription factor F isoform X1 [Cotesia glomerata]XP_044583396.1 probable basic-leucine zipper transcription factor F isoform X1 [Cotesia glomerata]KAH0553583.1 hypothetical protein KQX54_002477 [Cotesia glomerata]
MKNSLQRNRKQEPLPVDEWLKNEGYFRKAAPKDPACLFQAVSEQIYNTRFYHDKVRKECVEFMKKQKHLFEDNKNVDSFENYLNYLSNPNKWGGMMEIEAMSLLYKRDFVIFFGGHSTELKKKIVINNGFNKFIYLCHTPPRHYETVYKNQIMATAAFCQSIVYKILYQNVFKMPDIETTVEKMLHDDASYEDKASCTELSIPPIPYRVAKALDPNIYRNTDFDIWYELKSQVRTTGLLRWNNYRLQVGGKCFVKISQEDLNRQHGYNNHNNSNKYNNNLRMMNRGEPLIFFGHIQEMAPNKGPAVVFIEDLGENRTVPYRALVPWHPRNAYLPAITSPVARNKHEDPANKFKNQQFNDYRKTKDSRSLAMSPRFGVNDDDNNNNRNNNHQKSSPNKINYSGNNYGNKSPKNEFGKNYPNDSNKKINTQPQTPPIVPAENHKQNFNSVPEARDFEKRNDAEDSRKFVENKSCDTCEVQEKKEIQSNGPNPPSNFPDELILCNDMNCIQSSNEACFNLPNPYCDEKNFGESHSFLPAGFINYSNQVVNFRVAPSLDINGNDLPYSDISTLRYFFNLGLEYFNMNHVWWPQNEISYPAAPPNTPLSPPPSPPRSLNIIHSENPPVPVVDHCYAPLPPPVNENIPQRYDSSDYHKNYSPTNRSKQQQQQQQRYTSPGFNDNPNENSSFQMKMPSKKKSPTNNKFISKSKNEQDVTYNGGKFKYSQEFNENREFNSGGESPRKNQPGRLKKNNQGYQNRANGKIIFQHDQQKSYNPSQEENHFKRHDKKIIHDNQKKNQSKVPEMHNQSPSHCAVPQQMNFVNGPYYPNELENNVNVNVYGSPPPGPPGNVYPVPYVPHAGDVPAEVNNFSAPMMFTNPGSYPPPLPPMYPPVMYPPPPLMPHMTHVFNGLPGPNSPADWCVSPGGQPGCIPYPYPPSQSNEPAS